MSRWWAHSQLPIGFQQTRPRPVANRLYLRRLSPHPAKRKSVQWGDLVQLCQRYHVEFLLHWRNRGAGNKFLRLAAGLSTEFPESCNPMERGRDRKFADSPLEGDGFEPSVPGTKQPVFVAEGELRGPNRGSQKGLFLMRYRWFESISLQRRVHCKPDFLGDFREGAACNTP
jgi:hypothetical protein